MNKTTSCPECKSSRLTSSLLSAKLEPSGGGMRVAASVDVHASACLDCGNVSLRADPEKLKILAV